MPARSLSHSQLLPGTLPPVVSALKSSVSKSEVMKKLLLWMPGERRAWTTVSNGRRVICDKSRLTFDELTSALLWRQTFSSVLNLLRDLWLGAVFELVSRGVDGSRKVAVNRDTI